MPKCPKPTTTSFERTAGRACSRHQKGRFAIGADEPRTPERCSLDRAFIEMRSHAVDGAIPLGKTDRAVLRTQVAVHSVLFCLSALFSALSVLVPCQCLALLIDTLVFGLD
jgi:hypothetical protein